jgi:protein phosphatase
MEEYYKDMSSNIPRSLNRAFLKANEAVLAKGQTDEDLEGMASTMVTAVIKNDKIYFANVGDSRGYLIDQNGMSRFTEDHSYVASLVKAGVISEEEAQTHPESNIITRAIGLDADLQAFAPETPQRLKEGQYVLLCCDGLSGVVSDEEMLAAVNEFREPDVVCKELVKKANGYGGPDNITVIVARIDKIESMSGIVNKFLNLVRV